MSLESKKVKLAGFEPYGLSEIGKPGKGPKRGNRQLAGLLNGGGAHCIGERCSLFVVKCVDLSSLDQQLVD
jgi:hypothetical protein